MTTLHLYGLRVKVVINSRLTLLFLLVLVLLLPVLAPKGKVLAVSRPSPPVITRVQGGGIEPEGGSYKCTGQCPQQTLVCNNGTITPESNGCCITCSGEGGSVRDCCHE